MNVTHVLKEIGAGLINETTLGKIAMPVINALLPDDMKLPRNATGDDAAKIIKSLPPTERAKIELAEISLEKAEIDGMTERYKAMCSADGQETRARIVTKAMNALIWLSVLCLIGVGWVYIKDGAQIAFSVEMIGVLAFVLGPFAYVVRSYMGDLRTEAKSRHATIDSKQQPASFLTNILANKLIK